MSTTQRGLPPFPNLRIERTGGVPTSVVGGRSLLPTFKHKPKKLVDDPGVRWDSIKQMQICFHPNATILLD